ncbi:MAG TPA: hypothetical protein DDY20_08950 [Desulfobulbaceae bacterium]|jgi:uncharacterized protein with HEPN domain|nr:hypothetical protein [Desulfobulbaceae bacterium]
MKDRSVYLATALECIEQIAEYTHGMTKDAFMADRKTQDAVVRNLEIIGQALKDYGVDALTEQMPHMPWPQIAGMRNVLAHEYLGVDMVLIWEAIHMQLDELRNALKQVRH